MSRKVSRRDFLGYAAAGFVAAPFVSGFARGASATPKFEVLEIKTFSFPNDRYYGWPTVAKRGSELLVVTSGSREEHVCPFGRVEMFRSKDSGATWTFPQVLYDSPIDDRDAGICVTDKGTILVTSFTSNAYVTPYNDEVARRAEGKGAWSDERFRNWDMAHKRVSDEERQKELGRWMFRSTDGGITWSERYSTPFNSPHGPIQLSDGSQLYCGKELWIEGERVGAALSTDDGLTWNVVGYVPTDDGYSGALYDELHAVEASDGRIVAQIRNENPNNYNENLQTISKDGGRTWSVPRRIGVWGVPSFLTRLADGRLLMTYGHRRDPLGVQTRVSDDAGDTWSEALVIYGGGETWDLGYPSTVQLDDGSLLTVWYEVLPQEGPLSKLRSCRWTIS